MKMCWGFLIYFFCFNAFHLYGILTVRFGVGDSCAYVLAYLVAGGIPVIAYTIAGEILKIAHITKKISIQLKYIQHRKSLTNTETISIL